MAKLSPASYGPPIMNPSTEGRVGTCVGKNEQDSQPTQNLPSVRSKYTTLGRKSKKNPTFTTRDLSKRQRRNILSTNNLQLILLRSNHPSTSLHAYTPSGIAMFKKFNTTFPDTSKTPSGDTIQGCVGGCPAFGKS